MAKVFAGMSGGVDSSVTAALLVEQGHAVTGVYMKNWTQDMPGMRCPWADDLADAKRVAVQLGIPLKVYDFQEEYRQKVVDYMLAEYQAGRTPNPDVMCNQEVKFRLFLETALTDGAEMIATGHYARVKHEEVGLGSSGQSHGKLSTMPKTRRIFYTEYLARRSERHFFLWENTQKTTCAKLHNLAVWLRLAKKTVKVFVLSVRLEYVSFCRNLSKLSLVILSTNQPIKCWVSTTALFTTPWVSVMV